MSNLSKLILLAILLLSFFVVLNLLSSNFGGNSEGLDIYSDSQGKPMFATGNCNSSLDCFSSGCSDQVCANHEVATDCLETYVPSSDNYTCGCISNSCVWFK